MASVKGVLKLFQTATLVNIRKIGFNVKVVCQIIFIKITIAKVVKISLSIVTLALNLQLLKKLHVKHALMVIFLMESSVLSVKLSILGVLLVRMEVVQNVYLIYHWLMVSALLVFKKQMKFVKNVWRVIIYLVRVVKHVLLDVSHVVMSYIFKQVQLEYHISMKYVINAKMVME